MVVVGTVSELTKNTHTSVIILWRASILSRVTAGVFKLNFVENVTSHWLFGIAIAPTAACGEIFTSWFMLPTSGWWMYALPRKTLQPVTVQQMLRRSTAKYLPRCRHRCLKITKRRRYCTSGAPWLPSDDSVVLVVYSRSTYPGRIRMDTPSLWRVLTGARMVLRRQRFDFSMASIGRPVTLLHALQWKRRLIRLWRILRLVWVRMSPINTREISPESRTWPSNLGWYLLMAIGCYQ